MLGIRKLDGGPKAVAATFAPSRRAEVKKRIAALRDEALCWSKDRLLLQRETDGMNDRLNAAESLLDSIA